MGIVKNRMMECEGRGYGHNDKLVCSGCIGGKELKKFVMENGTSGVCDFCEDNGVCVTIETLCGEIMAVIKSSYTSAANELYHDSEEGFHGATTWDTPDLLGDLDYDMQLEPKVFDAVCNTIEMDEWCRINPFGDHGSDED